MANNGSRRVRAIGYIRVSSKAQGENGYGLRAQSDAIEKYCADNDIELLTVIPDVMSGRRTDRLYGRAAAVAAIKAGLADVLVLKDFDRATRDAYDGLTLQREAQAEGWRIVTTKGEDTDAISKLELTIKLAFAEEERERISERTKAGLARAKREGKKLGNESVIPDDVVRLIVRMNQRNKLGAKAIATRLTSEGIPAPGGNRWHYSTVRAVLRRWDEAA
ncbi:MULTISPECIES: recombinase family protein [Mycolicibacterium]|uniref:recombinase family protein n=1 Tax=Mycolicibacterium TaxID=1866885 RepID=UPI000A01D19B|nr:MULTISPECIES: recombinase family protein [Mycolicibacterium]QZY45074.1 recombinase family protein [Mycolicibacterium austroafricanum]UJL28868.1 recombinase family protein [Mycolicibacterium vanbaalenii]WND55582.1 recombinase family protein [Mycolicibacterium vanbaalenii]